MSHANDSNQDQHVLASDSETETDLTLINYIYADEVSEVTSKPQSAPESSTQHQRSGENDGNTEGMVATQPPSDNNVSDRCSQEIIAPVEAKVSDCHSEKMVAPQPPSEGQVSEDCTKEMIAPQPTPEAKEDMAETITMDKERVKLIVEQSEEWSVGHRVRASGKFAGRVDKYYYYHKEEEDFMFRSLKEVGTFLDTRKRPKYVPKKKLELQREIRPTPMLTVLNQLEKIANVPMVPTTQQELNPLSDCNEEASSSNSISPLPKFGKY